MGGVHQESSITGKALDPAAVEKGLREATGGLGAQVSFSGVMRGADGEGNAIDAMEIEHYPGMTERKLAEAVAEAASRWDLLGIVARHRHGRMAPGEVIVVVSASSLHRAEAFEACRYVVERLKSDVPFWKKEVGGFGDRWVEPAASDAGGVG